MKRGGGLLAFLLLILPITSKANTAERFLDKYESLQTRKKMNRTDRLKYLKNIEQVLAMTSVGRRVLDCFYAKHPEMETRVVFRGDGDPLFEFGQIDVAFMLRADEDDEGEYRKTLYLDASVSPLVALFDVAHEMNHSCHADRIKRDYLRINGAIEREEKGLSSNLHAGGDEILIASQAEERASAIEEVESFWVEIELYFELVEILAPKRFQLSYVTDLFADENLTLAQYYQQLARKARHHKLANFVIHQYVKAKVFSLDSVYEIERIPAGRSAEPRRLVWSVRRGTQRINIEQRIKPVFRDSDLWWNFSQTRMAYR